MMLSEEELVQCLQSVAGPKPTPPPVYPDLFPSQCNQGLLRKLLREIVKHPESRRHREVKETLEKIRMNKKIPQGNHRLETVLSIIHPPPAPPVELESPSPPVNIPSESPPKLVDSPVSHTSHTDSQEEKYLEA